MKAGDKVITPDGEGIITYDDSPYNCKCYLVRVGKRYRIYYADEIKKAKEKDNAEY